LIPSTESRESRSAAALGMLQSIAEATARSNMRAPPVVDRENNASRSTAQDRENRQTGATATEDRMDVSIFY